MRTIHVLRKPLSEGTVAANTLKHGTGGLNIDATRIAHTEPIKEMKAQTGGERLYAQSGRYETTTELKPSGRWPANVILQHLDGCRCDGVKRVKPSNGSGRAGAGSSGFQTSYVGGDSKGSGFTGGSVRDDGKESVANWVCEPGCPAAALDGQSGVLYSPPTYTRSASGFNEGVYGDGMGQKAGVESLNYGDSGGASRFFKQVGGKTDG